MSTNQRIRNIQNDMNEFIYTHVQFHSNAQFGVLRVVVCCHMEEVEKRYYRTQGLL